MPGGGVVAAGDQRQWGFGYGVGWGESGWGLHQYSGWGIGATSYTDQLDDSSAPSAPQLTDAVDDATKDQLQVQQGTNAGLMPTEARGNYLSEPTYTYAIQRPITCSQSSRYDILAIFFYIPLSIRPIFIFFVAEVRSNYLTTDGLKNFSLLPEAPLRPEARGICHICHMVNPALQGTRRPGLPFDSF